MPRGPQRQPIDPNLPPDTPLEPGSGAPRIKPGSAAARIAASEAALGNARPMPPETGGKSAAIAAARNAAKAAYLDTPVKVPKSLDRKPRKWLTWPFKKAAKDASRRAAGPRASSAARAAADARGDTGADAFDDAAAAADSTTAPTHRCSRGKKVLKLLKTLLIAASVAIIVVGVAQTAMEFLFPDSPPAPAAMPPKDQSKSPAATEPKSPARRPRRAGRCRRRKARCRRAGDRSRLDQFDQRQFLVLRSLDRDQAARCHRLDPAQARAAAPHPGAGRSFEHRHAAGLDQPGAAHRRRGQRSGRRIRARRPLRRRARRAAKHARGRRWFERAADAGFAPAQFRLASLNEKGEGVKKDMQAARRLYLAAAGKGHAKAMHNLAVLYAEGIDGKPDYKAASEWFRKAASYGVTDSQYNLAILYARGIGVQTNLAESYRWFALAAANGDSDAAKKRDEVAARLDQQTLAAAKLAVQAFIPEREPDEATNLKAPPGGCGIRSRQPLTTTELPTHPPKPPPTPRHPPPQAPRYPQHHSPSRDHVPLQRRPSRGASPGRQSPRASPASTAR